MDMQQGTRAAAPRRRTRGRQAARALVTACAAAVVVGAGLLAEAFLPVAPDPTPIAQAPLEAPAPQEQPVAMSRPVAVEALAQPHVSTPPTVMAAAAVGGATAHASAADRQRAAKVAQRAHAARSVAADGPRGGSKKVAIAAPARQAAVRVAPAPAWPDLDCDQSIPFAREVCKAVQCAKVDFSRHPVCVRMQADRRDREQLARSMGAP